MPTHLEMVILHMVQNSVNGVYYGTPRKYMEKLGGSGGTLYNKLKELGFEQIGKGNKAEWVIPQAILREFKK